MEQIIENVVIEGAEFQIIKKPATLYAGFKGDVNEDGEPTIDTFQLFQAGYKSIKNSLTPNSMLCLSINYKECNHGKKAARALMHCQETSEKDQPEGITVLESPACYMIRAKSTEKMWELVKKITGEENPQWHMAPLFGLCEKLFCNEEKGFALTPDFSNTYEIEYYNSDGINYAAISVTQFNNGL